MDFVIVNVERVHCLGYKRDRRLSCRQQKYVTAGTMMEITNLHLTKCMQAFYLVGDEDLGGEHNGGKLDHG